MRMAGRNKYGVRTDARGKLERTADGIVFDSKRECQRYCQLRLLETAGLIRNLETQPRFALHAPNGTKVGEWRGDFRYVDVQTGQSVTEDAKSESTRTALYRWKKKHVEAEHGIGVREV